MMRLTQINALFVLCFSIGFFILTNFSVYRHMLNQAAIENIVVVSNNNNEGSSSVVVPPQQQQQQIKQHITVTVPDLSAGKKWYSLALPIVEIPRLVKTAHKGAWFTFKDFPYLDVHLLETKTSKRWKGKDADVTGQHIGLDLGVLVGNIRDELYNKGLPVTLASAFASTTTTANDNNGNSNDNNNNSNSIGNNNEENYRRIDEQQAIFVTDPGSMTWEFTHLFSYREQKDNNNNNNNDRRSRPTMMELVLSNRTLPAKKIGIPLHRNASACTTSSSSSSSSSASTTISSDNDDDGHKSNDGSSSSSPPFKFAVSSGNPLASAAAFICLQMGGSAADATIAAASVMSVVEPYNGGLGGDFVALVHDPQNQQRKQRDGIGDTIDEEAAIMVLNGSGRVPPNAKLLPPHLSTIPKTGVESVLTLPGTAAAWCRLHTRHGRMPWELILQPAIMMAEEGFMLTERTAQLWEEGAKKVTGFDMSNKAKEEFFRMFVPPSSSSPQSSPSPDDGTTTSKATKQQKRMTPRAGERFYNPTLAHTLQKFADGGCDWFYNEAANEIVSHVRKRGGFLSKEEEPPIQRRREQEGQQHYRSNVFDYAMWEKPVSTNYTSRGGDEYQVFTAGGNSQAGSALLMLNILQQTKWHKSSANSTKYKHMLRHHLNAKRIVYRDTFRKTVYSQELVDNKDYAVKAAEELQKAFREKVSVDMNDHPKETSHDTEGLVVRDSNGLVISVLQSIALPFGSGVVVPALGFPLHGRGYGFDIDDKSATGKSPSIFSYYPGNRPWTTLSPFMVKRNNQFWMAASIKGGDRQPYAFTQFFLNMVELGHSVEKAVRLPRFRDNSHHHHRTGNNKAAAIAVEFDVATYLPRDVSEKVAKDEHERTDTFCNYLNRTGFPCKRFIPEEMEDSGFGVAQILLDQTEEHHPNHDRDPMGHSVATHIKVVSDLTRKPGLALTGEQSSLVAKSLNFPNLVHDLIDFRDLDHLKEPFQKFYNFHLSPLSESEINFIAGEGSSAETEIETLRNNVSTDKQETIVIGRAKLFGGKKRKGINRQLRHLKVVAKQFDEVKSLTKVDVRDVNQMASSSRFDAIMLQSGDYPLIVLTTNNIFPVGRSPKMGVDSYLDGIREYNSEFYRLLRSLVGENMPKTYDSREHRVMQIIKENNTSSSFFTSSFPLVIKKDGQAAGAGISIIRNGDDFKRDVQDRYNKDKEHNSFIIQEALKGNSEYTLHFNAYYGRLLSVECFESKFGNENKKEDKDVYIKGPIRPTNRGMGFKGCQKEIDAIQVVEKITRGTFYNGFGCLQYKKSKSPLASKHDSGDRIGIIELNPRTCGGLFPLTKDSHGYLAKVTRMMRRWVEASNNGVIA